MSNGKDFSVMTSDISGPAQKTTLVAGLYFVATPIGSARDITLRALDILASADVIAAEDTRTARHLMEIHGVPLGDRPLVAYHDHNGQAVRPRLIAALKEGKSVAYVSEAGTPLVADPGFPLGRAVISEGIDVFCAPGASAVLAALAVSGLPSDKFLFAGFAPTSKGARRTWLKQVTDTEATVILYESPKRIHNLLDALCEILDPDRQIAICRELTKRFEEILRGPLAEIRDGIASRNLKGEIVLVIDRAGARQADEAEVATALREAMSRLRLKDAAAEVANTFGLPRRDVYQMGLSLEDEENMEDEN